MNYILDEFPTAQIKNLGNNNFNFYITCEEFNPHIENFTKYIVVFINNNILYLDLLRKCNGFSGKEILNKIKNIAFNLKLNSIELQDASFDEYNLSISYLYILIYGKSWYNFQNFFSKNYENEIKYNKNIINLPIKNFINKIINTEIDDKIKILEMNIKNYYIYYKCNDEIYKYYLKEYDSIIRELYNTKEDILRQINLIMFKYNLQKDLTISEFVTFIYSKMRNDSIFYKSQEHFLLKIIIKLSINTIKYDSELYYTI